MEVDSTQHQPQYLNSWPKRLVFLKAHVRQHPWLHMVHQFVVLSQSQPYIVDFLHNESVGKYAAVDSALFLIIKNEGFPPGKG